MSLAPIALFAYNRPGHMRRTVETLLANEFAAASDLFVFSDGAKGSPQEPAVAEVRRYAATISGFRSVTVVERAGNMGLAGSIIDGTTRLTREFGRAIVLEDDLALSPKFLKYMNAALDRYRDDERVFQIAGHMFAVTIESPDDAIFLPFISSWGWGTWDRAWAHFDPGTAGFREIAGDPLLKRRFNLNDSYDYFGMLEAQIAGRIDSWAIRWYLSVFRRRGLILYPKRTLVGNFGFDGSGEHCAPGDAPITPDADFDPVRWPETVVNAASERAVFDYLRDRSRGNLLPRMARRIRSWLG